MIDLLIGGLVLPLRFLSAYGNPFRWKLCATLIVGEAWAFASVICVLVVMIYTRLYTLKRPEQVICRRYLMLVLIIFWISLFLFYGIPFIIHGEEYLSPVSNQISYCRPYIRSVVHPLWMAHTEIGIVYWFPFGCMAVGLSFLLHSLCQARPKGLSCLERKQYKEQRQMTWHVFLLGAVFVFLWTPWMTVRTVITFYHTRAMERALQITYYILIFKSILFPLLYAASNASFRGSFAIYRHRRITMNNRVWTTNA